MDPTKTKNKTLNAGESFFGLLLQMSGYLFGYPASKKQDAPGEGYPNADRGPAELLSYSIFSVSVDPVRILSPRVLL